MGQCVFSSALINDRTRPTHKIDGIQQMYPRWTITIFSYCEYKVMKRSPFIA